MNFFNFNVVSEASIPLCLECSEVPKKLAEWLRGREITAKLIIPNSREKLTWEICISGYRFEFHDSQDNARKWAEGGFSEVANELLYSVCCCGADYGMDVPFEEFCAGKSCNRCNRCKSGKSGKSCNALFASNDILFVAPDNGHCWLLSRDSR